MLCCYQEEEEVTLDHLPRRMKRREVNKERSQHDTHHAIHKEVIEVRQSDLREEVS